MTEPEFTGENFPDAGTLVTTDDGETPEMVTEVRFDDGVVQLESGRWVAISKCRSAPSPPPSEVERLIAIVRGAIDVPVNRTRYGSGYSVADIALEALAELTKHLKE